MIWFLNWAKLISHFATREYFGDDSETNVMISVGEWICANKLRRYFVNGVYLYQYSDLKSTTIGRYLRHRNLGDNSSFINSIRVHEPNSNTNSLVKRFWF